MQDIVGLYSYDVTLPHMYISTTRNASSGSKLSAQLISLSHDLRASPAGWAWLCHLRVTRMSSILVYHRASGQNREKIENEW